MDSTGYVYEYIYIYDYNNINEKYVMNLEKSR